MGAINGLKLLFREIRTPNNSENKCKIYEF